MKLSLCKKYVRIILHLLLYLLRLSDSQSQMFKLL